LYLIIAKKKKIKQAFYILKSYVEGKMPIYEFQCLKCQNIFEELVSGSQTNQIRCPKCNSNQVQRCLSQVFARTGSGQTAKSNASSCGSGGFS
jgi:putative FmdB family regulatory protein